MLSFSDYINLPTLLLEKIAEELDIPDYLYEDAVLKYEDIGDWLSENGSALKKYSPEIYPQGSFRLGTVVRPFSEKEEYDIDLVCCLEVEKEKTTQVQLKEMIGNRLEERDDLKKILESSRRCWVLNFPKQFHMDALPAIPNLERLPTGILLTDEKLTRWQKSNPKAYAAWFYKTMEFAIQESRTILAKSVQASVEDVPDWKIKTPLQYTIQLLKRHRDIYFQNNLEHKPVSIILTTLAARAYKNQLNIVNALTEILDDMPKFIEKKNDKWWVSNPVDPDENFADKWNEKPELEKAFRNWLHKAYKDFCVFYSRDKNLNQKIDLLKIYLGQQVVAKAVTAIDHNQVETFSLIAENKLQVPNLGDIKHVLPPIWNINDKYKASVKGTVFSNKRKQLWAMINNKTVPKNIWLQLKLETNTPAPYEVKWQVVNTGQEANEASQLRGEFYDNNASTKNVRWERTAFRGTHWVEAFVIKNSACVARSGRKYVRVR